MHGKVPSSLFWQPTTLALPDSCRPPATGLRGFGDTEPEPADATRGPGDYTGDLAAVIDTPGLDLVHLVGWSMGGGAVPQYRNEHPAAHRAASVTLVAPVSPFGFGATRGTDGTLRDPSGAGSGAGSANPEFVERLTGGDRTSNSPTSPRQVLLAHYVKPPIVPPEIDIFAEPMLSTRIGDEHHPGTSQQTAAWPRFTRGDRGVLNTMAPTHFRITSLAAPERTAATTTWLPRDTSQAGSYRSAPEPGRGVVIVPTDARIIHDYGEGPQPR